MGDADGQAGRVVLVKETLAQRRLGGRAEAAAGVHQAHLPWAVPHQGRCDEGRVQAAAEQAGDAVMGGRELPGLGVEVTADSVHRLLQRR